MQVRFKRTGGFAGLLGPGQSVDLQTDALPPEKAKQLHDLVATARFFEQPARPGTPGVESLVRDGYQYDLSVDDGERSHSIQVHDGSVPPEISPLIQWLAEQTLNRSR